MERLRAVLEAHCKALEVVQSPRGDNARLVPVLGVDQDLVERLVQVDLTKDDTAGDVVGEVTKVWEGVLLPAEYKPRAE